VVTELVEVPRLRTPLAVLPALPLLLPLLLLLLLLLRSVRLPVLLRRSDN
jgi:hypothetical protein